MNIFHLNSFSWWSVASSVFKEFMLFRVKHLGFGFPLDVCEVQSPHLHLKPPRGPVIRS